MKVRMLVSMAGNTFTRDAGTTCEIDDIEAMRLCDVGFAEPLAPEVASVDKAKRNATKPKGKPRGAKADNAAGS